MNFREKSLKKKGTQPPPIFRLKFTSCKGLDFETWRSLCTTQPTPNQPPTNPAQLVAVLSSEVIHFFEQGITSSGQNADLRLVGLDVWMGSHRRLSLYRVPTYPLGSPNIAIAWKNPPPFFKVSHTSSKGWFTFQPAMLVDQRVIFV